MASVTILSGPWPVGTTVGIYPITARHQGQEPGGAPIATSTVGAASASSTTLTVTDAGIVAGGRYVAYALIGTRHAYVQAGITTDAHGSTVRNKVVGTSWPATVVARRTAAGTS